MPERLLKLAMTQPSVSNKVSRMRHAWNTPLFVEASNPPPIAHQLWHQRNDRDLGLKWLRKNILKIVDTEIKRFNHKL